MKEQSHLVATLHRTTQPLHHKNVFMNEIESRKRTISQIKTKHQERLKNAQLQLQQQNVLSKQKPNQHESRIRETVEDIIYKASKDTRQDTKNANINDTDKMLFEKKFKNFLNHRQQFQEKAKQRQRQIMQERKKKESGNTLNQQEQDDYVDKEELMKDTKGENQFQNAQEMIAFYEEITFGKKNKKNNVHLYHAQKIEYQFRREEFGHLIELETLGISDNQENQLPALVTSVKKDTVLNYLFEQPAVMMLYSINPYLLGDELAEFETSNNGNMNFEEFSNFLILDRQPTYFEYSKQNLAEARKLGRGIKCQPIISKWIGDQETYEWLIQLFRSVDIMGEEQADREVLVKKIRKQAEKKRILDEEIIEIVNINKLITLDRILYEIQFSASESSKISLEQFDDLLRHYHRLETPEKDKLITKLILAGKYDPSYVFILGNEPIDIIKETFHSMQKLAQYFVPRQKFIQKLVKNPKFNKIRNIPVRSQANRYVKRQTIQQTLARFLNQAQPFVDIEEIVEFFTNRGRPRKVQFQIYLANLQAQIARIEEEQRRKSQKKLSQGDYSTSSDEEEFQKSIKQKAIQRKKDKLASIRASQKFTEGKKFNVTVPNAFSFGDGKKEKNKISIREKKIKQQLDQKRRQQDEAMKPILPRSVPQHVKEDLYQKLMRQQERERKQRLERFRIQIQQSMYPISPHLLSKPKSKSIYEQPKEEYKFIAKPLPWYCEVNLLERIQKEKDERRERILQEIINKNSQYDLPDGVKKMFEREEKSRGKMQRMRAQSQTTANANQCTFQPKITDSIPDFHMIHEHLYIDLENRKQQKKPIQVVPFSFENRPHRSRTTMEPHQKQSLNKLKQSKQSEIHKEQVNIPITQKHLALINLRRKQEEERMKKVEQQKRASTVRKMRQQKFAPYVREILRKSRVGDVAHSRAIIDSKIQEFKKEERKRKRQYEEQMIKIYTKVFNRPLLVEGDGERRDSNDSGSGKVHEEHPQARNLQSRDGKRKNKGRENMGHYAEDYEMEPSNPADQYSRRKPQQDEYDDLRRKAIEHPPRNYLMQDPDEDGEGHEEDDFEGQYLSENGRYTN